MNSLRDCNIGSTLLEERNTLRGTWLYTATRRDYRGEAGDDHCLVGSFHPIQELR